jgi:ribose transport system permease protein
MKQKSLIQRFLAAEWSSLLIVAVIMMALMTIITPRFLNFDNQAILTRSLAPLLLVAFAQAIVIGIGQMNLAVGAIGGLIAVLFGGMLEVWGLPIPVAIAIGFLCGLFAGTLSGAIIAFSGINGFIVTLAMLSVFKGLNLGITKSIPFYEMPEALVWFGEARIGPFAAILVVPVISLAALAWFLKYSLPGRQILAVGGNAHAAGLAGISVNRVTILAHAISGALAGIAGMVSVARLGVGQPTIGGDWLLASFAAPVIGGAILAGGHIPIAGTILGVLVIILIENLLVLYGINPLYNEFFVGALILLAVGFNHWRALKAEAAYKLQEGQA